jgi:26S proteasome regulatory subunit N12
MVAGGTEAAAAQLASLKAAFGAEPCDLAKCAAQLTQLKLLLFSGQPYESSAAANAVASEALELACFLSIRQNDLAGFERHVSQLKMYYDRASDKAAKDAGQRYTILGLYLLHLLASDRIGDFHIELELIRVEEYDNIYIKRPIDLERALMEGNYAKVLEARKDVPKMYYSVFMDRLLDTVRMKVGVSLERSYESLPAQEAATMLILTDVAGLQEFAVKENERKAREEADEPGADLTPSLAKRAPVAAVRWEVKDGRLHFKRTEERRLTIPALDLMVNTIGYATDLERIV